MEARHCIDSAYLLLKETGHSQYDEYFEDRLRTLDETLNAIKEA
jgi:hypothetical protein